MKQILNGFLLAAFAMIVQACGSKTENKNETSLEYQDSVNAKNESVKITRTERRAKLQEETALREERRRLAFEEQAKLSPTFIDSKGKVVYNKAEVDPSFTGGKNAMMKYINDNIQFPKDAHDEELEGTVFVDFIVTATGDVREVVVTDAPGEEVDQRFRDEAIRVVSAMPKWIPGTQRGKPVEVKYSLPITFAIQ